MASAKFDFPVGPAPDFPLDTVPAIPSEPGTWLPGVGHDKDGRVPLDPGDDRDLGEVFPFDPGGTGSTSGASGTGGYQVAYFIKDHLGSPRVVVENNGSVLSRNDYYPFGLTWENPLMQTGTNRYLYNGKELQDVAGLGYLDYGARMYDGRIGRWFGLDPLLEKYCSISPFAFTGNNPVRFVDLDGRDWYWFVSGYRAGTVDGGKGERVVDYMYFDYQLSEKEMNAQGLTHIGLTGYTLDESQYLSLFGQRFPTKTESGGSNVIAEMVANIDKAIINSYHAEYLNQNQPNPAFPEYFSSATTMELSYEVTPQMVSRGAHKQDFNYGGGKIFYVASNIHNGWSFS